MKSLYLGSAMILAASAGPSAAQDTGTLKKIKDEGAIKLGYREYSIPFSYIDNDQKPIGFAMDLCNKIVENIRSKEGFKSIRVVLQAIQNTNQIPLIQNGTIDIVCGPTTNTLERQKVVAFSNTFFVSSIRAVVPVASSAKSFTDLANKPVALTSGTTSIQLLTNKEQQGNFKTNQVLSPDHAASFLTLTTGRTQAFVMDDILLAGLVAKAEKPTAWRIIDDSLRTEPYGLVIRKDDAQFKSVVDGALDDLMKNGQFKTMYDKWFVSPIPPNNIDLHFPMSQLLQEAVAHPNDKGV